MATLKKTTNAFCTTLTFVIFIIVTLMSLVSYDGFTKIDVIIVGIFFFRSYIVSLATINNIEINAPSCSSSARYETIAASVRSGW